MTELRQVLGTLGLPMPLLDRLPEDLQVTQTILVKVTDPSPRRIRAKMKVLSRLLSDQEVFDEFSRQNGWDNISEVTANKKTRLDIKYRAGDSGTTIAIQLRTFKDDTFIQYPPGQATCAVMKSSENSGDFFYQPQWVTADDDPSYKTVRVIADDRTSFSGDFVLGVKVVDGEDTGVCPVFIDPKIENNG